MGVDLWVGWVEEQVRSSPLGAKPSLNARTEYRALLVSIQGIAADCVPRELSDECEPTRLSTNVVLDQRQIWETMVFMRGVTKWDFGVSLWVTTTQIEIKVDIGWKMNKMHLIVDDFENLRKIMKVF